MATKSANVMARVEPEVKEQAENILNQLGIPASTVINLLYRQIIMTKSVPFALAVPSMPIARDEMTDKEFGAMMAHGLQQAKADQSDSVTNVFARLRQEV